MNKPNNKLRFPTFIRSILPRNKRCIDPSNSSNKIDDDLDNELHDIQKQVDLLHVKNFDILSITKKFYIDQNIKMDNGILSVRTVMELFQVIENAIVVGVK